MDGPCRRRPLCRRPLGSGPARPAAERLATLAGPPRCRQFRGHRALLAARGDKGLGPHDSSVPSGPARGAAGLPRDLRGARGGRSHRSGLVGSRRLRPSRTGHLRPAPGRWSLVLGQSPEPAPLPAPPGDRTRPGQRPYDRGARPVRPRPAQHVVEDANEEEVGKALPESVIRQLDAHIGLLGPTFMAARSRRQTCRPCSRRSTGCFATPAGGRARS